ncbi:DNA repair protein [Pseudoflavonifractor phocaeensis]|uniref:DNA repair protein n=1 Tax=Pseudoflavonifractor phocaeensis TaxID=1870988 RepID=UPI001F279662|nr:DNA repair protein [Pseudoflavonifractor phocaeensis]MCF2596769.1 DNA repair protein [Pseudoflavonifractor phocaeensis]
MGRTRQTEKNPLRKLSKLELLELLAQQERELQSLRAQLAEKEAQLEDRMLTIRDSGSIAEAALKLNDIFEVAQKAADQYLENVKARASQPTGGVWPVLEQSDEEKPS